MEYEAIIGLEVHTQLLTETKIFCGCSTKFGAEPNSQTCPVCLGMPGVLPVLNKKVVEFAVLLGLATHCQIRRYNRFARKNYFYPDLPKGYQISQFEEPICENGYLEIETESGKKRIGLIRIHMEEDAGKSVHDETYVQANESLIDLNRCGTPLLEIVSAPDIRSPQEAHAYLAKLRQLVRYLGISDGNMEEGSFRCDANISVRPVGQKEYGTRTELKNMNSFAHVQKALEYEIARQTELLKAGKQVEQQTLLWDADNNVARAMRGKEESHDYRYFPEPDLVPIHIDVQWFDQIQKALPELPEEKFQRFTVDYKLPEYDARLLTESREVADYFERVAQLFNDFKMISNWMLGEVARALNEQKISITEFKLAPQTLADLLKAIKNKVISGSAAKKVFEYLLQNDSSVEQAIEKLGLKQISDESQIEQFVVQVIEQHPAEVESFKAGKTKVIGFLVGQVMRLSRGKANPQLVNQLLQKKLNG
ncbi:Aspartyl/glutamyl-tRNA(Asn/Gln) amidotransferase subunit B [Caldithrix abyssi DSM 13497]|uniref:Aspartyl/glutamyl-tRNA(Asn/Gln) amidotransferase subunit B n=1 Tax=Caldithrix abyssi DSM 13497 TaxID=880073 RepID=H1XQR0_CALAY|nr:Asp-tRNA(Asn)/Glu-tRNA(Gln) amidotransferase subunit GatB [Caldithrix abyssi]APF18319.1 gatB aspartyl/glutamyl-tRNA(Asn/Gln) amidotransferase subunit B [Caldithrix abyssi DSM 13497]EHO42333.1 Aspartyl/glutamyl-tRNA(Asn/Gln) amidotransferase subunit B [Caldithrix abyssi DSM 13497]